MLALVLWSLAADPAPIPLERVTAEHARTLDGRTVTVTLLVAKPTYPWRNSTVAGPADQDDEIERTVVLRGNRDIHVGRRVTVTGTLSVLHHPANFVGEVFVPAWVEVRVEERR